MIRRIMRVKVGGIGAILIVDDSAPSLNTISRDKKLCGKLMTRQILARFDPDKKRQLYDKKSVSVRQP